MTRPTLPFEWYRVTNRMNCGGCSQRQLLPVTKQVIYDHMAQLRLGKLLDRYRWLSR